MGHKGFYIAVVTFGAVKQYVNATVRQDSDRLLAILIRVINPISFHVRREQDIRFVFFIHIDLLRDMPQRYMILKKICGLVFLGKECLLKKIPTT